MEKCRKSLSLIERRVKDLSTSTRRTSICIDFHTGIVKPFDIVRVLWKKYKINFTEIEIITNVQHLGFFTTEILTWFAVIWTYMPSIGVRASIQGFCTVNCFGIFGGSCWLTPSGITKKADQPELI